MHRESKCVCFIGARSGSKGLPNKNIRDFCGKPLIHWTIRAAVEAEGVHRVIVSTDCPRIAEISRKAGAETPFLRPKELAQDESLIEDAIKHCLGWLKTYDSFEYEYILRLQPTSPLRTSEHIESALEFYFENRISPNDTLVSVTAAPQKAGWLLETNNDGYIAFALEQAGGRRRRQEIKQYYYPNGAIYFGPISGLDDGLFYTRRTIGYPMPSESSIDIDSEEEFLQASSIFRKNKNCNV